LQTLTALWLICTALATKETIEETIRFATEMVSPATPYRGTSPTIGPYAKPRLDAKIAELVGDTDVQLVPLHEPHFSRSEIF
jgi:hypothetical protein